MQTITKYDIPHCPKCNGSAILVKDVAKSFQVRCSACGHHTKWGTKSDVMLNWCNAIISMQAGIINTIHEILKEGINDQPQNSQNS